jgi:hypothetical protein
MKNTVKTQLESAELGLVIVQFVQVETIQELLVQVETRPVQVAVPVLQFLQAKRYGKDLQLGKY